MQEDWIARGVAAYRKLTEVMWRRQPLDPWLETDLTMPQLRALFVVGCGAAASQRDLQRMLGVGPSTVSALVDRLVDRGWLLRAPDPTDRRVVRIALTADGAQRLGQLRAASDRRLGELFVRLAPSDLPEVVRHLELLSQVADGVDEEGPPEEPIIRTDRWGTGE